MKEVTEGTIELHKDGSLFCEALRNTLGRRNSRHKGPEAGLSSACWRNGQSRVLALMTKGNPGPPQQVVLLFAVCFLELA